VWRNKVVRLRSLVLTLGISKVNVQCNKVVLLRIQVRKVCNFNEGVDECNC
jgi:hypothetical protein